MEFDGSCATIKERRKETTYDLGDHVNAIKGWIASLDSTKDLAAFGSMTAAIGNQYALLMER